MPQRVLFRKQDPVTFAASQKQTVRLGRGMILREIMLKLSGQLTVGGAGANNTAANITRGDEWGVVKEVALVANGNDVLRSISGTALRWLNYFMYGRFPRISSALAGGGTNPKFWSALLLPLWMPQSISPIDTCLNTALLSDLRLEITWGTHNDICSHADCTGFTVNPAIEVTTLESYEPGSATVPQFAGSRIYRLNDQPAAATTQRKLDLPPGPLYRGFLINCFNSAGTTDTAFTDPPDTPAAGISNIALKSGTNTFRDVPVSTLFEYQGVRINQQRQWIDSSVYPRPTRSSLADIQAWYFLDLVSDGYMSEAVDSIGLSELYLEFNVAAACQIDVFPIQVFPLRKAG